MYIYIYIYIYIFIKKYYSISKRLFKKIGEAGKASVWRLWSIDTGANAEFFQYPLSVSGKKRGNGLENGFRRAALFWKLVGFETVGG